MITPRTLTNEMIWQLVKAAADARNTALLGYCTVALRGVTGGGLKHARQVLCQAANASIAALRTGKP